MFAFLKDEPLSDDMSVLISFHYDVRESVANGCDPIETYLAYVREFPQFRLAIKTQFLEDKVENFPSDEQIAREMFSLNPFQSLIIQPNQDVIISPACVDRVFQEYMQMLIMMNNPYARLMYQIEERVKYLNKYHFCQELGFKVPFERWDN